MNPVTSQACTGDPYHNDIAAGDGVILLYTPIQDNLSRDEEGNEEVLNRIP